MELQEIFALIYMMCLGAIVGSFLNVCIHRFRYGYECLYCQREFTRFERWPIIGHILTRGKCPGCGESRTTVVSPPSFCPKCKNPIRWFDNLPILSYIILGGKCRNCKCEIKFRYVMVEFLIAIYFIAIHLYFNPLGNRPTPFWSDFSFWSNVIVAGVYAYLGCALLAATIIDLKLQIIPESITRPGIFFGLLISFLIPSLQTFKYTSKFTGGIDVLNYGYEYTLAKDFEWLTGKQSSFYFFLKDHPHINGLLCSLAGIAAGAGICWLVMFGFTKLFAKLGLLRKYGEETAMGYGDVTLMAFIGAFVGWKGAILTFWLAPILGSLVYIPIYIFKRLNDNQEDNESNKKKKKKNSEKPINKVDKQVVNNKEKSAEELLDEKYGFANPDPGVFAFGPYLAAAALIMMYFEVVIINSFSN